MLKKIAAVALVAGSLGLVGVAHAETLCVTSHIDINGTVQDINQCV
jgi:hypothetical protein